jgi:hypothetical protein
MTFDIPNQNSLMTMNDKSLNTPVLFLIFNQPTITQRVFNEIRKVKPKKLFVSADGHRDWIKGEEEECDRAREIVKKVDWDCELYTNFLESNHGSAGGVSLGIRWFFDNVEEGIILEYDCLPVQSFFFFCEKMLNLYRNDSRIMAISGSNYQLGKTRGNASYYFSRIPSAWGWATWKRAWKFWDGNMPTFPSFKRDNLIKNLFNNSRVRRFWCQKIEKAYEETSKSTWGFAWVYAVFLQNGLCVTPNVNMISNIGFSELATHAKDPDHFLANLPTGNIHVDKLTHPYHCLPDLEADEFFTLRLYDEEGEKLFHKVIKIIKEFAKLAIPKPYYFSLRNFYYKHFKVIK